MAKEAVLVELDRKGNYSRFALNPDEFRERYPEVVHLLDEEDGGTETFRPMVHIWVKRTTVGSPEWTIFFTDKYDGLPEGDIENHNPAEICFEDEIGSLAKEMYNIPGEQLLAAYGNSDDAYERLAELDTEFKSAYVQRLVSAEEKAFKGKARIDRYIKAGKSPEWMREKTGEWWAEYEISEPLEKLLDEYIDSQTTVQKKDIDVRKVAEDIAEELKGFEIEEDSSVYEIATERFVEVCKTTGGDSGTHVHYSIFCHFEDGDIDWQYTEDMSVEALEKVLRNFATLKI